MLQKALPALLAGALVAGLAWQSPAQAAPLILFEHGAARVYDEPRLPTSEAYPPGPRGVCAPCSRVSRGTLLARTSVSDPVRRAVNRAYLAGRLNADEKGRYLSIWAAARRARRHLAGQRRSELGYVIATLGRIARAGRLKPDRMRPLFLILDRNRQWWSSKGAPAPGARVRFGRSRVIFQYYPGAGLQLQPLGNFGLANGYWSARQNAALQSLVHELAELGVHRGGFVAWEYYFHFGGGAPPWISGMAQGTAMQALARASDRLDEPRLLRVATRARGAFARRTPGGVRVPLGSGSWYALYSFSPRLYVLNGMLQSLIGLDAYISVSRDEQARRLFEQGDRAARARIRQYDTGAWSLYSRYPGRPGPEANLNYHTLNRDFARRLCRITNADAYCTSADNFSRYLREDPTLRPARAVPSPAVAGRGVLFKFTVSKIGRVGITVTAGGRSYLSTSASFSRGPHSFRWVPPRVKTERTYDYTLSARDLAGNTSSLQGSLRVRGRR